MKRKVKDAAESGLHDYVLKDICVDYRDAVIVFKLISVSQDSCELCIKNFNSFSIKRKEPWGPGILIFYSEVELQNDGSYRLYFQLNSGDEIEIYFEDKEDTETGLQRQGDEAHGDS